MGVCGVGAVLGTALVVFGLRWEFPRLGSYACGAALPDRSPHAPAPARSRRGAPGSVGRGGSEGALGSDRETARRPGGEPSGTARPWQRKEIIP